MRYFAFLIVPYHAFRMHSPHFPLFGQSCIHFTIYFLPFILATICAFKCVFEVVFVSLFSFPFIWQPYTHLYILSNGFEFSGKMLCWWGQVRLSKSTGEAGSPWESTIAHGAKFSHTLVWPLELGLRTPTLRCGHLSGPSRTRKEFFDFEVGGHDGAYKGRVHVIVPFVGRKNGDLIDQQSYNVLVLRVPGLEEGVMLGGKAL